MRSVLLEYYSAWQQVTLALAARNDMPELQSYTRYSIYLGVEMRGLRSVRIASDCNVARCRQEPTVVSKIDSHTTIILRCNRVGPMA